MTIISISSEWMFTCKSREGRGLHDLLDIRFVSQLRVILGGDERPVHGSGSATFSTRGFLGIGVEETHCSALDFCTMTLMTNWCLDAYQKWYEELSRAKKNDWAGHDEAILNKFTFVRTTMSTADH